MPVVIKPTPSLVGRNSDPLVHSEGALLKHLSHGWRIPEKSPWVRTNKLEGPETRPVLRSSFERQPDDFSVIPYDNGVIHGIIRAFEQDLHLVLRPDDIWLAILVQFNFFVNGNVEALRKHFVAHKDKKKLELDMRPFSLQNINLGQAAQKMTELIQNNVTDDELRDWILPNFSTTDDNDRSVASIVMMSTLQGYFEFEFRGGCGFPSVTLLGERSDWEMMLWKVRRLPRYGEEAAEWCKLLVPVIKHMVGSFDQPNSQETKDFWLRVCHSAGVNGSAGVRTLSGWITAFCFWDEKGKRIKGFTDRDLEGMAEASSATVEERRRLWLDGVEFPVVWPGSVDKGVVTVPVGFKDFARGLLFKTTMVAGSVGMACTGDKANTVQPTSGWWMLQDSVERLPGV